MQGNFDSIIQDPRPVVIDFHALWCGPCKVQSPILKEVASELGDRIRVIKIQRSRCSYKTAANQRIAKDIK